MTRPITREREQYTNAAASLRAVEQQLLVAKSDPNLTPEQVQQIDARLDEIDAIQAKTTRGMDKGQLDRHTREVNNIANLGQDLVEILGSVEVFTGSALQAAAALSAGPRPMSGSDLNRLAVADPAAFAERWESMSDSERQSAQIMMQNASAMQMQLTSLTSTLLKNQHESSMAVIRNIAV